MAADVVGESAKGIAASLKDGEVELIENVRFHKEEEKNDPAFAQALREAYESGVTVLAMDCLVEPGKVAIHRPVEIRL